MICSGISFLSKALVFFLENFGSFVKQIVITRLPGTRHFIKWDGLPQGMKGHSSCARSPRRSTGHRYIQNNDGSKLFKFRVSGDLFDASHVGEDREKEDVIHSYQGGCLYHSVVEGMVR